MHLRAFFSLAGRLVAARWLVKFSIEGDIAFSLERNVVQGAC